MRIYWHKILDWFSEKSYEYLVEHSNDPEDYMLCKKYIDQKHSDMWDEILEEISIIKDKYK